MLKDTVAQPVRSPVDMVIQLSSMTPRVSVLTYVNGAGWCYWGTPNNIPHPTGESNTVVSPTVPGGLSDGQWHTVHLRYYNKVGTPPGML